MEAVATTAPAPIWHGVTAGAASALASRIFTREHLSRLPLVWLCMHAPVGQDVTFSLDPSLYTDPADTVKARLQMQGAVGGSAMYLSTLSAFRMVCAQHRK